MNSTIAKLNDEFEKMEKTIAFQKKMLEVVKPYLDSACGVVMASHPCPEPRKLEDCTWGEIDMYSTHGFADKVFKIGDTKKFQLEDGSYLTARIIGFNHDHTEDGSLVHITFETVETLDGDIPMNGKFANEGGWNTSYLRFKLNGDFFKNQLPDDLKEVIKPVTKITAESGESQLIVPSVDKLFVLSEQEIFGRKIYSCGGEGKWYDWYKLENNLYGKCKQSGERDWRWERSTCFGSTSLFCYVDSAGVAESTAANNSRGVSFGFCV